MGASLLAIAVSQSAHGPRAMEADHQTPTGFDRLPQDAFRGIDREGSMEAAIRRMQEAGVQLIESSAIDGRPFA
ncbi:hypothetical protein SAMN03159443_00024 [Pseudomonas sp. NFACC15-1]|nr:hypothetical protein SAMN03159443_00024 [Pseudomonas sp. NFACC15-1]SDW18315.1 hypothetical protein SAMN03159380_00183 [Pseudomonas sp. NFACC14]